MGVTLKRMSNRIATDFAQASMLLRDDHLIWSEDFEAIRKPLAALIDLEASTYRFNPFLTQICQALIQEENDITIGN
jgi:hypothetical protein